MKSFLVYKLYLKYSPDFNFLFMYSVAIFIFSLSGRGGLFFEVEGLDFVAQSRFGDTQFGGGPGLVVVMLFQGAADDLFFDDLEPLGQGQG